MKFTSISKNKIVGFALLMLVASSLAAVMYFFSSAEKSPSKMPQSVIASGVLTPTEAQSDTKAVMGLASGTTTGMPPTGKSEAPGLSKNEEVVKPVTVPGRDAAATTANKKNSAQTDAPVAKPSASAATNAAAVAPSGPITLERWSGPTLGDLEKLRSENAMLAEQLKNAELKTKIAKEGGVPGLSGSTNPNAPSNPNGVASGGGPRVVMIAGGENNYRANIALPNGRSITAQIGTTVPGLGIVSAITPDVVIFGSGKIKRSIPLVTNGANAESIIN